MNTETLQNGFEIVSVANYGNERVIRTIKMLFFTQALGLIRTVFNPPKPLERTFSVNRVQVHKHLLEFSTVLVCFSLKIMYWIKTM